MLKEYTHIDIGKEIRFISGFYEVEEEKKIRFKNDEVLVIIGHAIVDGACCGIGACRYALVPGKIKRWRYRKDENGNDRTEVDTLSEEEKMEFEKYIKEKEVLNQVVFW